ncbi:hypothetical protein OEZ86_003308 [Tetradesmus obliquus]|nr:hypothetical protein OEZ86_003308 [Tetradesmus obliquus]
MSGVADVSSNGSDVARLDELCQAASEAASQLSRLWKQSAHTKLLQQPPTQKMSAKHAALFLQSKKHTAALEHALSLAAQICADLQQQGHPQHGQDFVDRVLASKPVPTLTRLLMWLQQKPERLQLHALEAWSTSPASSSSSNHLDYGILWMVTAGGLVALLDFVLKFGGSSSSSSSSKTPAVLGEQLIQQGLPLQLPAFLLQSVNLLAAAGQPVVCSPLRTAMRVVEAFIRALTHEHCVAALGFNSSDVALRKYLTVSEMLFVLSDYVGDCGEEGVLHRTRRDLFTSQLARKNPVPFFQLLDICVAVQHVP